MSETWTMTKSIEQSGITMKRGEITCIHSQITLTAKWSTIIRKTITLKNRLYSNYEEWITFIIWNAIINNNKWLLILWLDHNANCSGIDFRNFAERGMQKLYLWKNLLEMIVIKSVSRAIQKIVAFLIWNYMIVLHSNAQNMTEHQW